MKLSYIHTAIPWWCNARKPFNGRTSRAAEERRERPNEMKLFWAQN
jgi:hypothetical protein